MGLLFFFPCGMKPLSESTKVFSGKPAVVIFQLSSLQIGELPISPVFERLRWCGPSLTSDNQGAWLCSLGGFQL